MPLWKRDGRTQNQPLSLSETWTPFLIVLMSKRRIKALAKGRRAVNHTQVQEMNAYRYAMHYFVLQLKFFKLNPSRFHNMMCNIRNL